jgi:hypothetical protein
MANDSPHVVIAGAFVPAERPQPRDQRFRLASVPGVRNGSDCIRTTANAVRL